MILRIWGLTTLVQLAIALPNFFVTYAVYGDSAQEALMRVARLTQVLSWALAAAAAITLIVTARAIARWIVPEDETWALPIDARQLFVVAIAILGLWFIVHGVANAGRVGAMLATKGWDETPPVQYVRSQGDGDALPNAIVYSVAGIALLATRRRLAESWAS